MNNAHFISILAWSLNLPVQISMKNFRTIVEQEMYNIKAPFFLYQTIRGSPLNKGPKRVKKKISIQLLKFCRRRNAQLSNLHLGTPYSPLINFKLYDFFFIWKSVSIETSHIYGIYMVSLIGNILTALCYVNTFSKLDLKAEPQYHVYVIHSIIH